MQICIVLSINLITLKFGIYKIIMYLINYSYIRITILCGLEVLEPIICCVVSKRVQFWIRNKNKGSLAVSSFCVKETRNLNLL